jgi:thiol-disulfide isomerase/thioredoxin
MTAVRSRTSSTFATARLLRPVVAAAFAAALVLFAGPGVLHAQNVGLEIGAKPEAVALEDLDGNPVDLARWVGKKPLVLEFWATWCPLCAALEPQLKAAKDRWGDRVDVVFIAVGVNQSPRSIRRHLERHPMPGPMLWDGAGRAVRAFKAPTTSYVVILDAAGAVRYTGVGEDQDIAEAIARIMR